MSISFKYKYIKVVLFHNRSVIKTEFISKGDYVPQNDDYSNQTKSEYDFVLALSITKWIHLNNGDEGVKRFFKKIYLNLNINGSLLLEPQSWTSYRKKAKLNVSFNFLVFVTSRN